jgi:hypothetical protein
LKLLNNIHWSIAIQQIKSGYVFRIKNAADNEHALQQRFFEYRFHHKNDVMYHITEIETIANQLRVMTAPFSEGQIMIRSSVLFRLAIEALLSHGTVLLNQTELLIP